MPDCPASSNALADASGGKSHDALARSQGGAGLSLLTVGNLGHNLMAAHSNAKAAMEAYLANANGSSLLVVAKACLDAIHAADLFQTASRNQADKEGQP